MTPEPEPGTALPAVRRALRYERGLYPSLWQWLRRRTDLGPSVDSAAGYPYVGAVSTTMWVLIGLSMFEVGVVHLLVPWDVVRWVLLVLSAWALVWMCGFVGSLHVHPHLVGPEILRVRYGHTIDVRIDRADIASASVALRSPPGTRTVQADGSTLVIAVGGQVNVHVRLCGATTFTLPGGRFTVDQVSCWADDPNALATALARAAG